MFNYLVFYHFNGSRVHHCGDEAGNSWPWGYATIISMSTKSLWPTKTGSGIAFVWDVHLLSPQDMFSGKMLTFYTINMRFVCAVSFWFAFFLLKSQRKKILQSETESALYIISLDTAMGRNPNAIGFTANWYPMRRLRTTAAGNKVGVALQQVESLYVLLEPKRWWNL